jgi:hypothetical protein
LGAVDHVGRDLPRSQATVVDAATLRASIRIAVEQCFTTVEVE